MLQKAISLADNPTLLECFFYQYAHAKDENSRKLSLAKIKESIKSVVRSPGWNLQGNVNRAIKDGHPHPQFLETLAKVILDEANVKELDNFDVWTHVQKTESKSKNLTPGCKPQNQIPCLNVLAIGGKNLLYNSVLR